MLFFKDISMETLHNSYEITDILLIWSCIDYFVELRFIDWYQDNFVKVISFSFFMIFVEFLHVGLTSLSHFNQFDKRQLSRMIFPLLRPNSRHHSHATAWLKFSLYISLLSSYHVL